MMKRTIGFLGVLSSGKARVKLETWAPILRRRPALSRMDPPLQLHTSWGSTRSNKSFNFCQQQDASASAKARILRRDQAVKTLAGQRLSFPSLKKKAVGYWQSPISKWRESSSAMRRRKGNYSSIDAHNIAGPIGHLRWAHWTLFLSWLRGQLWKNGP